MKVALIIVDVQKDFLPTGSLPVPKGNEVVEPINTLIESGLFDLIVATKDWHPPNHGSFAKNHNAEPYTMGELCGLPQMMWPTHCVENTKGSEFADGLKTEKINATIHKGRNPNLDSYSGFGNRQNAQNFEETNLDRYLQNHEITEVFVCGLATDYCVKATALDAAEKGYKTTLLLSASRGVSEDGIKEAIDEMWTRGVTIDPTPLGFLKRVV